ncbi:protein tiptop [Drosophila miranda]|uniref:protein tiptop n=1 Tax=Drosophila miranda TaxID=7229 RepID=UPI0007E75AEA|nr:protein tiptop [Drosophila miranda]XP_017155010.1 protein tiptop [Drosophila miranda]
MMLHEAVMLEIYRQALSASELASPRCQSRESNASAGAAPGDGRCPSNESHCSANDCLTPAPTPTPTHTPTSPTVGLPLTATLAPGAAAALLPPQSAAMAAYLAAAQQNHLLLTNPLAAAASLVQQATQQAAGMGSPGSMVAEEEAPALDFSRKRPSSEEAEVMASDEEEPEPEPEPAESGDNGPLDLSVSTRKRQTTVEERERDSPVRKLPRATDYKSPLPPGSWVPPLNPYLAAVAAKKMAPSEATKALEKMSEMSRLETPPPASNSGSSGSSSSHSHRSMTASASAGGGSGAGGRHSAWQSHWLNKGADAAKDVFKCVWCKQSFATLASLTTHMKETQHCGVQIPSPSSAAAVGAGNQPMTRVPTSTSTSACSSSSSTSTTSSNSSKSELNMLIKETMPLPRKLVRGQDVWLGKGAEQTRQILKCMWCGQSFRSLAEMTSHMQETQHYTNIISQEQIISWKSGDERERPNAAPNGREGGPAAPPPAASSGGTTASASVSAVLTCKVCDQAFSTLKDLSTHMAQQSHYKESPSTMSSSSSVSPPAPPATAGGGGGGATAVNSKRGRQTRNEKRKKSLPVRKLLELERSGSNSSLDSALKPLRDFAAATKITCEKCGSKIETALFVEHIRKCLGDSIPIPPRRPHGQSQSMDRLPSPGMTGEKPPSVLNALEQLIEKSFESRGSRGLHPGGGGYSDMGTPLGASILKRLGIDDSSDYTKPLMDAHAMHLLRSSYASRDRSASESSSASRVESAYTPDRQQATPRRTPDTPAPAQAPPPPAPPTIKAEPLELDHGEMEASPRQHINVKKEFSMDSTAGNLRESPRSNSESPSPQATTGGTATDSGSLLALNSMFDQLSGVEANNNNNNTGHCYNNNNNNTSNISTKKPKAHPLAALQKLCDTTDPPASNTRSAATTTTGSATSGMGNGGNDLVAFSWACNEAVLSASSGCGGDASIIKCSFCDTPFGSKGAYRHHLSKVHFVKDNGEDSPTMKSPGAAAQSPKSLPMASPKRSASRSPAVAAAQQPSPSPTINPYDESPQSKFLKYTELAKQLSSKNA